MFQISSSHLSLQRTCFRSNILKVWRVLVSSQSSSSSTGPTQFIILTTNPVHTLRISDFRLTCPKWARSAQITEAECTPPFVPLAHMIRIMWARPKTVHADLLLMTMCAIPWAHYAHTVSPVHEARIIDRDFITESLRQTDVPEWIWAGDPLGQPKESGHPGGPQPSAVVLCELAGNEAEPQAMNRPASRSVLRGRGPEDLGWWSFIAWVRGERPPASTHKTPRYAASLTYRTKYGRRGRTGVSTIACTWASPTQAARQPDPPTIVQGAPPKAKLSDPQRNWTKFPRIIQRKGPHPNSRPPKVARNKHPAKLYISLKISTLQIELMKKWLKPWTYLVQKELSWTSRCLYFCVNMLYPNSWASTEFL